MPRSPRNRNPAFVSTAWKFFDKVTASDNTVAVVCKLCEKQYKFAGNTSNLRSHLVRAHPIQWELTNSGTLDDETLQRGAYEFKTDGEQSDGDNLHEVEEDEETITHFVEEISGQHSNEEWLEEDHLSMIKKPKRKRRTLNVKREVVSPTPRKIYTFPNNIPEMTYEMPSSPPKDEYSVFGEYIANKLRKFSKARTRGNIQQLITTILWQAEYGMYDNADSVKRILMNSPEVQSPETLLPTNVCINGNQWTQIELNASEQVIEGTEE